MSVVVALFALFVLFGIVGALFRAMMRAIFGIVLLASVMVFGAGDCLAGGRQCAAPQAVVQADAPSAGARS